jgi:peptidyl-prolyl cis-trans isomerase D
VLQTMRSWAKYIWIFVIAAPFIFVFLFYQTSGLGNAASVTPSTPVAKVDGQEILYANYTRQVDNQVQSEQRSTARSLTQDEIHQIQNSVFDQMVTQILLDREYKRRGISVTPDEIREYAKYAPPSWLQQSPDLQTDGKFDMAKYQRLLQSPVARQEGLLVQLEDYYRTEIPKQKLFEQVTAGVYVTDADLWRAWQDSHDSAQVSFVSWNAAPDSVDRTSVTDAEIRQYYDAHHDAFTQLGSARLSVVEIPRVITAADSAAVRARLLKLREEISSGTSSFADVAKRASQDSASATSGGDLGMSPKGQFVQEFDSAAWALKPGQLSGPVLTPFGYHLLKVNSRKGDSIDVSHILLRIQPTDSNQNRIDREADSLANIAATAEVPAKLDSAAGLLHLTIYKLTASENQPAMLRGAQVPSASAWAFGGARPGDISDLFDDDNGYYLARLDSLTPGGLRDLSAVRAQIRTIVAAQHHLDRMMDPAKAFAAAAAATSLEAAARKMNVQVGQTATFTRTAFVPGLGGQFTAAVGAAFGLPLHTVSAPVRDETQITVEWVGHRVAADSATWLNQKNGQRQQRITQLQQARVQMYLQYLHDSAKIDDRRKSIDAAIRRTSS